MTIAVIVTSIALVSSLDPDDVLKERFLKECPAALTRLESHFSRVQGVAHSTVISGKSKGVRSGPIEFAADGPNKIVRYTSNVMVKGQPQTVRHVQCLAGTKSFSLRADGDGPYRITSVGDDMAVVASFDVVFGQYLYASCRFYGSRLAEMIHKDNFRLIAVSELSDARGALVQAEFESHHSANRTNHQRMICDPANEWRFVESEVRSGSPAVPQIMKVDYGSDRSSTPTYPVSIFFKDFKGKETFYEFESVDLGPVDPKVFQIETYGLNDMSQALPGQSSRLTWAIVAAGVVATLLIGALILKRAADRRR
jgi:hypothetical protein